MADQIITAQRLREVMSYDPQSGVFTWRISPTARIHAGEQAGWAEPDGRCRIMIDARTYYASRLAWLWMKGVWPSKFVDHMNGDGSDNKWLNLRDTSVSGNNQNQRKPGSTNTSGYLGVTWDAASNKWLAQIKLNNRTKGLGRFDDVRDAAQAYLRAKRVLHSTCTI